MKFRFLEYNFFSITLIAVFAFTFTGCNNESCNPIGTFSEISSSTDLEHNTLENKTEQSYSDISNSKSSSSSTNTKLSSSDILKSSSSKASNKNNFEISPIHFSNLNVISNNDKSEFKFEGIATLEIPDSLPSRNLDETYYTGIDFKLAQVNESGILFSSKLSQNLTYNMPVLPAKEFNFSEMQLKIDDPNKIECGNYRLYITAYASDAETDYNGYYNPQKFILRDSIEFFRDTTFCTENAASSSSQAIIDKGLALVQDTGSFSSQKELGFSFIKSAEVSIEEANIAISVSPTTKEFILKGVNGFKVTAYSNDNDKNFDDDWDPKFLPPPNPAHTSDFRFEPELLGDSVLYFNKDRYFIAIGPNYNSETGEDFYVLALYDYSFPDANEIIKANIIYYKVPLKD